MKSVIKKVFLTLSIIITLCFIGFSNPIQADPAFVSDCLGEKADTEDCKEESEAEEHSEEKADENDDILSEKVSTGSLIFSFVKTGLALLLILVLIYFLLKFLNKRNKMYNQVKTLENLGGIAVGQNKSIQIVRVGTKAYMIGVGENVQLLQEINDEKVINDLLQDKETPENQMGSLITSVFKSKTNETEPNHSKEQTDFKNLFSNELNKLKENRLKIKNQRKEKED